MTEFSISLKSFDAWYKAAVIITCSKYKESTNFKPLPSANEDGKAMAAFLKEKCQFQKVELYQDKTLKYINQFFGEIVGDAKRLSTFDRKGIFFVYYSGHGTLQNTDTYGHTVNGEAFNLEDMVRLLSSRENTKVISFFDCCRTIQKVDTPEKSLQPEKGQYIRIYSTSGDYTSIASTEGGLSLVTESFLKFMQTPVTKENFTPAHDFPFRFMNTHWPLEGKSLLYSDDASVSDLMPKPPQGLKSQSQPVKSELQKLFELIDANGDKTISVEEVMNSLRFLDIKGGEPHEVRHYMSHWMCISGSRLVEGLTFNEFEQFYQRLKRDLPELQQAIDLERSIKDKQFIIGEQILYSLWETVEINYKDRKPNEKESIPWHKFSEYFWPLFLDKIPPTETQQKALKKLLNVQVNFDYVGFKEYTIFVKIFACLLNLQAPYQFIDEIVNTANQSWFFGYADRNQVEAHLKKSNVQNPGIVRISTSQYFFCLSSYYHSHFDHKLLHPEFYERGFVEYAKQKARDQNVTLL